MSGRQRLTFLGIAALIAVVAIVVLVSGGGGGDDEGDSGEQAAATATATPTEDTAGAEQEEPTATPTPRPRPPLLVQGSPRTLRFTQGERIRFRVRAQQADEVHVHGFDLMKDVAAGQTVTFSFPASITGIFEVELEESGVLLGNLRVDPA